MLGKMEAEEEGGDRGWNGWIWHYQLNGHESEQTLG